MRCIGDLEPFQLIAGDIFHLQVERFLLVEKDFGGAVLREDRNLCREWNVEWR